MESLNYTQLAEAVLALAIFSSVLLLLILGVLIELRSTKQQLTKDFLKEDEAIYQALREFQKKQQDLEARLWDLIESHPKQLAILKTNIYQHLEARFDVLIKPKYAIGDKILCSDGERGAITKIEKGSDNSFWYTFKTRKYFNHPARELRTSEHGIVNKY